MNISSANRFVTLAVATTIAMLHSASGVAAPKPGIPIFSDRAAAKDSELPALAKVRTGVVGTLNSAALSAPSIDLTLSDGRTVTARLQRVAKDDSKSSQSWVGTFDDSPGSVLVLTKAKGVVSGFATIGTETFEVVPQRNGKHLLFAVDARKLPETSQPVVVKGAAGDAAGNSGVDTLGTGGAVSAADGTVVQDLLVVYTANAAAQNGAANLESMIRSAVEAGNQAYLNSGVRVTLNLVGVSQVALVEGASQFDTLEKLRVDSQVANLREQSGADIVSLVGTNADNCGQGYVMQTVSTTHAVYAFSSVNSSCLSSYSLIHEVGHNQGLMHDRDSSSYGGAYPYAYGYRVCASDGTGFRDIMSYSCSGAPRVLLFSTPYQTYNGHEAGIAYETNPAQSAENVRALNNTATTVAAFRASKAPVTATPAAPTGLVKKSVAYNQAALGWVDNSPNETGFKLERSSDGVNFSEIATLGADAAAYTDSTVAAKSNYYYRVRAYNGAGVSAYSGTLNVTTPDVPPSAPAAPASPAASNNGDGSSSVSWTASSGANNYDVRRETYNATKRTWGNATTVASVSSAYTSMVDLSGAGTFRYSVRATNAGGVSAYAGPVQVTVTAATASLKKGKGRN